MEEKPTKHQKSRLGRQPWKDQSPIQQFEGITVRLHTSDFRKKREFVRAVLEAAKSQADTQWIEAKIKPNISKSLRGRPEARQRIENAGLEVINDNYRQVVAITNARMRSTEKTKALGELKLTQQRIISQVEAKLEAQFAKDGLAPPAHEDTILKYVKGVRLSSLTDPGTLTLDKAKWVTKHHPSTANSILKLSDLFHGRHSIPEAILQRTAAPHLLRYLTIAYTVGPRESELLKLEWPYVDMRRREFTSRKTKNGETRVVPMTLDVFVTFTALHQERRLDTQKVFLYNGRPWKNPRTAFAAACRLARITGLRLHNLRHTASTNETGRGRHYDRYEERRP